MILNYKACDSAQTEAVGRELAELLDKKGTSRAFIAMHGEMGAGKTAFVRGFGSYFGVMNVKSPTYTVVNEYRGRVRIHHFDLYRIADEDDLYSIGYFDIIEEDGYSIAEWSENIESAIPDGHITVTIERISDDAETASDGSDSLARHIKIELPNEA